MFGIESTPQKAIGIYNCDLAVDSIAVEIFGGGWHGYGRHKGRSLKRFNYLFNLGWNVVIVWIDGRRYPLSILAAQQIHSFTQLASSNPALRGQYWVIRGDGKLVASGSSDGNDRALIEAFRT